ncbi:MAG: hypothetical protein SH820_00255 [Xanthomonadales bacterium]|nr:hypothetical protein [Xanthomonadales bacterium]
MNEKPQLHANPLYWEEQINALLDGELNDEQAGQLQAAARNDPALAQAIVAAYQLQQALEAIPQQRAPASLRHKLTNIPDEQGRKVGRKARPTCRSGWFQSAWISALAAIPLVIIALSLWQPAELGIIEHTVTELTEPTTAELREARRELAVAFGYLGRVGRKTGLEIGNTVNREMQQTINENMIRTIQEQMEFNKERNA